MQSPSRSSGNAASMRGARAALAMRSMASRASPSRSAGPSTQGTSGLQIPAFSPAMAARVLPSHAVWSKAMRVIAVTAGAQRFVASRRPPTPTSITAISTPARAKARHAMSVRLSKRLSGGSTPRARSSRTRRISSQSAASSIGASWITTRSATRWRCGDV